MVSEVQGLMVNLWRFKHEFFRRSTVTERKSNKVESLLDDNHQWEFNQGKLKELAVNFYK